MAYTSSRSSFSSDNEVYDDSFCSKSCRKNTENLNNKVIKLNEELSDCETDLYNYKRGLSQVEARLVEFKNNEIKFCERIRVLERDLELRDNKIENLRNELEEVKKEKESIDFKIEKFDNASKDLDSLLGNQRLDKDKKGLGFNEYSVVPPPPAQVYSPPKNYPLNSSSYTSIGINKARVMSDSKDFTVTYTEVSSPFEDLSDIGSPRVVGPEYEELPWMIDDPYVQVVLQAPPSPDYVPGPEEPEQAPPLPDFVLEPVYPEFMTPEDEVLPVEEKPLPAATSPTADSPGYVPESDPEDDPEGDDEEDPEEDPADYLADEGDDGDDKDESSYDDEDDDVDIEEDEEEEEHPAHADSIAVALPTVDQAPSAEETKPFETDESADTPSPHPAYRVTARMAIRDEPPTPFWSEAEHTRADTPPSCTLPSGTPPLLPIPLPTSSPPLHLLSTDRRADRPEVTLLPWKRLGIALGPRYEVGESSSAPTATPPGGFKADYGFVATMEREIMRDLERDVGYGIIETWDEMLVDMPGAPATDETELGQRMTNFVTTVRQDTYEIYMRLDDKQIER
ncbi:hypothetical protein Tco_0785396 [Tanacetum coccineum]